MLKPLVTGNLFTPLFFHGKTETTIFLRLFSHFFFPKASPMLGFSFSLLEGGGGARIDRTLVWTGCMMMERDGCDTGWM